MIISRTPFRVSFFGGGTDYPTWYRENSGCVISTTINKYCYVTCRFLPPFFEHVHRIVYSAIENVRNIDDINHPSAREVMRFFELSKGIEIHHDGDLPARSGIASSSAFTVGLINALGAMLGQNFSKSEIATHAIDIEQNRIKETVGSQDQVATAYGGLNRIDFKPDGTFSVSPLGITQEKKKNLENHLMLYFTGQSRYAPEIAKCQLVNFKNKVSELKQIQEIAISACASLEKGADDLTEFARSLDETWKIKRSLADEITNDEIDSIYTTAKHAGAVAGKLIGAGGGGFILFFVPPDRQDVVAEKLNPLLRVPFKFEGSGTEIIFSSRVDGEV